MNKSGGLPEVRAGSRERSSSRVSGGSMGVGVLSHRGTREQRANIASAAALFRTAPPRSAQFYMTRAAVRDAVALSATVYDPACRRCARLARHLQEVRAEHPAYFCLPVPPFGDTRATLVIVGLAPGKHGANATGRPFTGDYAGILLYATLYKFGFASRPESTSAHDGLRLKN